MISAGRVLHKFAVEPQGDFSQLYVRDSLNLLSQTKENDKQRILSVTM